jgi:uncharacterized protein YciI
MKRLFLIFGTIFLFTVLRGQSVNPQYDSTLAKTLGADEYGNKSYILVILKSGTNNLEKGQERNELFRGHMENINRMAEEGKLVISGPMDKNDKTYQGIFILNVTTKEEAAELLKSDPVIREKILDTELFEWYGSAAISEYLKVHKKIEKKSF